MGAPERRPRGSIVVVLTAAVLTAAALSASGCKDDPDPDDPGDDDIQPGDTVLGLQVRPSQLTLDTAADYQLLCVATTSDGYEVALSDCAFELDESDETLGGDDVLQLAADGHVVAVGAGAAAVVVQRDGMVSAPATVTVIAPGTIDVRVTDQASGEVIEGARVRVGCAETLAEGLSGADGHVTLAGDFAGPVDLVIEASDHRATVLQAVVARNVAVALRTLWSPYPRARARGDVTFVEEPLTGQMAIALVLTSTPEGPAFTDITDYMPGNRLIEDYGLNIELPTNLVIKDLADDFSTPIYEGEDAALSVAAGNFDLGEILSVAVEIEQRGPSAVFNVIGVFAERLTLGLYGPYDVPYETFEVPSVIDDLELVPTIPLDREVSVSLPDPPVDFYSVDPPTVLAYRVLTDDLGWAIAGVGVGEKPFSHPDTEPPQDDDDSGGDDDGTWSLPEVPSDEWNGGNEPWEVVPVLEAVTDEPIGTPYTIYGAMAVYEGLGVGGDATMSFSPPMTGADVRLPHFLPLIEPVAVDNPRGHFAWEGGDEADIVWSRLAYWVTMSGVMPPEQRLYVDVYSPPGAGVIDLPEDFTAGVITGEIPGEDTQDIWITNTCGLLATDYQAMITDDGHPGLEHLKPGTNQMAMQHVDWWAAE